MRGGSALRTPHSHTLEREEGGGEGDATERKADIPTTGQGAQIKTTEEGHLWVPTGTAYSYYGYVPKWKTQIPWLFYWLDLPDYSIDNKKHIWHICMIARTFGFCTVCSVKVEAQLAICFENAFRE